MLCKEWLCGRQPRWSVTHWRVRDPHVVDVSPLQMDGALCAPLAS